MLVIIPTVVLETVGQYFNIFWGVYWYVFEAFVVVGLSEEFFKRLIVMKFVFHHPAYNERLDGIVYCSVAALGFATLENVSYVLMYYFDYPDILLTRALLSVPVHMLLGITMGYFLSQAKFCTDKRKCASYYRKSLLVPMLLHGAYDFILLLSDDIPVLSQFLIPFVVILWISGLVMFRKYYKDSKARHYRA